MRSFSLLLLSIVAVGSACHSAPPPPPPPPPRALNDSAAGALRWVDAHAASFNIADSVASAGERAQVASVIGSARVFGLSELSEGTHEFPYIVRRTVLGQAEAGRVRGLAIQAPMAEAMEIDRYVRGGSGDALRLLRTLGNWRWETREMRALVEAMRAWNANRPAPQQVGFYGFEIPSAAHAVSVVLALPDSVVGASLKSYLTRQYSCVAINEGAHWGLEGRTADSSYWNACGPATTAARDSVVALRRRLAPSSPAASNVAFAEAMASLIQHHVRIGLRHLKREELNAEHVMYLADVLGPDATLVLWGGDVEMGRLTLDRTTVQTGMPLGQQLGDKYRAVAFAFGTGTLRTRTSSGAGSRGGGPPNLSDVPVRALLQDSYEEVFARATPEAYWLDMRALPSDIAGHWLGGPRAMRLVTEFYLPTAPEATQTPVEFPKFFDAVVFAKHVTPAKQ
jgi:erythromycin esterase-like protein